MTNSEGFFSVQAFFSQEYLAYCKEKTVLHRGKEPLFGRFDSFGYALVHCNIYIFEINDRLFQYCIAPYRRAYVMTPPKQCVDKIAQLDEENKKLRNYFIKAIR